MTTTTDHAAAPADEAAPTVHELGQTLEGSGKVQFDPPINGTPQAERSAEDAMDAELSEMRVISKRLKQLTPDARKRVLTWLVARFGA